MFIYLISKYMNSHVFLENNKVKLEERGVI
jgi:hypothetical protein